MPELPEVEHFTQYFNKHALKQPIENLLIKTKWLIRNITPEKFTKILIGKKFKKAYRRGKFMVVDINRDPHKIIFHFGMTGDLFYAKVNDKNESLKKYSQVTFVFTNLNALYWLNKRKFGGIYLVTNLDEISTLKNMGPEPLNLTKKEFLSLLDNYKNKNIKAFLMDQSNIAGIGNEYSNEILFQAGIDPHRKISNLNSQEKNEIFKKTQAVLKNAINVDTLNQKLPQNWLLAHKKDLICPIGKEHKFKKIKIAGRSAVYCPLHQK